jgi:hypothetical protein
MSDTIRVPRPKGLTNKAKSLNTDQFLQYVVSTYIQEGFTYMGVPLSISELAFQVGVPPQRLGGLVVESSGAFSSLLTPDSQAAANKSLAYLYDNVLTWAFQDRFRADQLYSQSAEQMRFPNGTIKTNMANLLVRILEQGSKSSKTLIEVLNSLRTVNSAGQNPMAPQAPEGTSASNKPLTSAEAIAMLQDMAQIALTSQQTFDSIYAEEGIEDVDEVRAMGAETAGTKTLKASRQELLSEEIILQLELPD